MISHKLGIIFSSSNIAITYFMSIVILFGIIINEFNVLGAKKKIEKIKERSQKQKLKLKIFINFVLDMKSTKIIMLI